MKRTVYTLMAALLVSVLVLSCKNNGAKEAAEELLGRAGELFDRNEFDSALVTIDALREIYPTAVETRRKALVLQQMVDLKKAQMELAITDSLLQVVTNDYNYQKMKVDREKADFKATHESLHTLTMTQMKRDSLKARCEILGAKIRYIHKKQKE